MGMFVDIEGAFDCAPFQKLCDAARAHGVDDALIKWIHAMLTQRLLCAEVGVDRYLTTEATKGCPQGGVFSPLLWSMLIDSLLCELQNLSIHAQAYADDVAVLAVDRDLGTVCRNIQRAVDLIDSWCLRHGLSVNLNKTTMVLFTKRRKLDGLCLPEMRGTTLQLSEEVKYLGVTLDKKLLWNKHVEVKMKRALTAYGLCRRTFASTWGLRPHVVMWIYVAIIRPMFVYASVVWWVKVRRKSFHRELDALQRTVCLGVTGTMSTTSGAALNALLNLQPLDIFIQSTAMRAAHRLIRLNLWENNGCGGHRALEELLGGLNPVLTMTSDSRVPIHLLGRRYVVTLKLREDGEDPEECVAGYTEVFYTDGSKTEEGSGAGVYLSNKNGKWAFPLGQYATVFQAEVYAILRVANWVIDERLKGRRIAICSDSQAALRELSSPLITSKIVQECRNRLNSMSRFNTVELLWVPGHCGIEGNEISDALAKEGSISPLPGPEPAIGVSVALAKSVFKNWEEVSHNDRWQSLNAARHTKLFLPEPNIRTAKFILSKSRRTCRCIVGILTGHNSLAGHMFRIGITEDDTCPSYNEEAGSTEHFLCECPAYGRIRHQIFGVDVLQLRRVASHPLTEILRYVNESGIFR
ncbi:unnamed protein product [Hermetia illucens]|uniref:Uncharacterized protein n=1 Tax=Hermetia illucens TaxID=343691 RepID=A0A7R8UQE6_HERIL|nr:unnamed protein product [Hermetia illucens]